MQENKTILFTRLRPSVMFSLNDGKFIPKTTYKAINVEKL